MTATWAAEYLSWAYPVPYDFYNIPPAYFQECLQEILEQLENWWAVVDKQDRLLGFMEYRWEQDPEKQESRVTLGLGLKPEETGKGQGAAFVKAAIAFAPLACPPFDSLVLRVASFNRRAITVYLQAGFSAVGEQIYSAYGSPTKFTHMALSQTEQER